MMNVQNFYKTYFNDFQDIKNYKKNDVKTNALAAVKIISYFTIVIPMAFAAAYGAASLYGRISKKESLSPEDKSVDDKAKKILLQKDPIIIRPELADLPLALENLHNQLCNQTSYSRPGQVTKEETYFVQLDGINITISVTMKRRIYPIEAGFPKGKISEDVAEITITPPIKEIAEVIADHFEREFLYAFGIPTNLRKFNEVFINGNKAL